MKDTTDSENKKSKTNGNEETADKFYIRLYRWVIQKGRREQISTDQMLAYSWLYAKNKFAHKEHHSDIYGKHTLKGLWIEMGDDLGIYNAGDLCRVLEAKGWIVKARSKYNGTSQKGYLCLLDKEQKALLKSQQQELHMEDEEAVVQVESSLPDTGEYVQFGIRYYDDADGNPHQVPSSAPPRPTKTAVWSSDPEGWYEPEDLPTHDLEY